MEQVISAVPLSVYPLLHVTVVFWPELIAATGFTVPFPIIGSEHDDSKELKLRQNFVGGFSWFSVLYYLLSYLNFYLSGIFDQE